MSNQGNRHPSRNEGPISDDSLSELLRPVAEFNASMDMQAYDWANMSGYPFPDNTDMLSGDPNRLFNGEQNWPRAFPDDMLVSVQTEHMFGLNDRDMFQMPAQNGISNRPVSQQRRNRRGTAAPVYQPPSSLYPPVLPYPSQPTNYPFLPILHPSPMYGGPPPPPYLGWNGTFSPEQPVQSTAVFDPSLPTTNPFVTAHNASMAPVLPVTPAGGIPKNAGARSNEVQLNSSAKSNTNTAPKCKKIKLESQTESDHSCLWVVSRDSFPQVICGQTFTSPRQLANHIHRGHIVPIDGLIHCSWQGCCKFRSHNYLNKAKVQRHVLGHAKRKWPCRPLFALHADTLLCRLRVRLYHLLEGIHYQRSTQQS